MNFKKSPVVFNEEHHRYTLNGKELLGITGLIHSILGLGVYPDAEDYVKDFVIPRAGSRGTAVHHAIQTYDETGIMQTMQIVRTRYGCRQRDNITYKDEEWDVSNELFSYIRHCEEFEPLANELTVSDNEKYASQIDNVWRFKKTGGIWLVDTKTNNLKLYPVCGYFKSDYFATSEEALKEYLSWQLSIYAVLFEMENPGIKVEGLACNWLRSDDAQFWIIERKPDELVRELLTTDYAILESGPVYFHHDPSVFGIGRTEEMPEKSDATLPIVAPDVVSYIGYLLEFERDTKAKLDEAKKGLREAMMQHNVRKFDSGLFKATLAADHERTEFDKERFKKEHPDLYNSYLIKKTTKGSFTIK